MNKQRMVIAGWVAILFGALMTAWPLELCWNYLIDTGLIPWHRATFLQTFCASFVARSLLVTHVQDFRSKDE